MYSRIKTIFYALILGAGVQQGFAMEQSANGHDKDDFFYQLLGAKSYGEFVEVTKNNQPITDEDKLYSQLYIGVRFNKKEGGEALSKLITIAQGDSQDAKQKALQALLQAYRIADYSKHIHLCITLAQALRTFEVKIGTELLHRYLCTAVQHKKSSLIEALFALSSDPASCLKRKDANERTLLYEAIRQASDEMVAVLCKHKMDFAIASKIKPNEDATVCSVNAACQFYQHYRDNARRNIVESLLCHQDIIVDEPVDTAGTMPLCMAAHIKSVKAVKALLAHPRSNVNCVNEENFTPLHVAIGLTKVNEQLVDLLLAHPAINPNCHGGDTSETPLHMAAGSGAIVLVRQLIGHKATNVNELNRDAHSALDVAIMIAHEHFTDHNAEISEQYTDGLHEIIALLLRFGSMPTFDDDSSDLSDATYDMLFQILPDIFVRMIDPAGLTPNVLESLVKLTEERKLRDGEQNIDLQDKYGATLLMYVAGLGNTDLVSYLLEHKANPLILDKYGYRASTIVTTIIKQKESTLQQLESELKKLDMQDPKQKERGEDLHNEIKVFASEVDCYRTILSLLEAAEIKAVTTHDQLITLDYDKKSSKRKLEESVESGMPAQKKSKTEQEFEEEVFIPKKSNYIDTLPSEVILLILSLAFGSNHK